MPAYYLEFAVVVLGLALLMAEAFTGPDKKRVVAWGALIGLGLVLGALFTVKPHTDGCECNLWRFYTDDTLALFYKGIALVTTMVVILLGLEYLPVLERSSARAGGGPATGEFFCLPVFICAGLMWMASAVDLTSIFVSLELVTISFYVMTGYMRRNVGSLEAGVKYLILGALSTGFLVYGFTWLYGVTGSTNLEKIALALETAPRAPAMFAFALVLVALCFKIAAVPFHIWVPDVYQGAPTPVTAYLSVGSKAAGFIIATRVLEPFLNAAGLHQTTLAILVALAAVTLLVGNLAAIPQANFKRLLAYSSVSHAGFLLLALACGGAGDLSGAQIVAFYLAAYLCMTLLVFAVLVVINRVSGRDDLPAFNGLYQRSPFLSFALVIAIASLAGVPLTAGFLGKLYVFMAAAAAQQWIAVGIAVVSAAAGFYYYFKVLKQVFWYESESTEAIQIGLLTRVTVILLIAATLILGVYPAPVMHALGR